MRLYNLKCYATHKYFYELTTENEMIEVFGVFIESDANLTTLKGVIFGNIFRYIVSLLS